MKLIVQIYTLGFIVSHAVGASAAPAGASAAGKLSFNTHIQPLLSEYCYHCHGPDSGTRKPKEAPLRLDREEYAFQPRPDGKPTILKGDPAGSDLVRRLKSTNASEVMPPVDSHKKLKPEEIALIEQWVKEGANYEEHWSFIPPVKPLVPAVPATAPAEWKSQPVDAFVLAKMSAAGLAPGAPEEKSRLLRRVTFDLTGLPPTPEEVAAYMADSSPDAYEKVVERLLGSPRYGENMARYWLDAARYADTHGIHIDNYRSIWPYRDWVIEAFNANMPFDKFTIEQIGGDLLPAATLEQKVATGFNRCLPTTGEGGAIPEEYDAIYAKDRVETTSGVWLGLTMGCAACHDHKFDPLAMKEFYEFSAFFRNTPMSALDGNNGTHAPNIGVPRKEDRPRYTELSSEIAKLRQGMAEREKTARPDFEAWLAGDIPGGRIDQGALHLHLPLDAGGADTTFFVDGTPRVSKVPDNRVAGIFGPALAFKDGKDAVLGDLGNLDNKGRFTFSARVRVEGTPTGSLVARMDVDANGHAGWDLSVEDGRIGIHLVHKWPENAIKCRTNRTLASGQWHTVAVVYDGTKPSDQSVTAYIDGKQEPMSFEKNALTDSIHTNVPLRLGRREPQPGGDYRIQGGGAALQDFRIYKRMLQPAEIEGIANHGHQDFIHALPKDQRTPEREKRLFNYYLSDVDPVTGPLREKINKLEAELKPIQARGNITLVMEEIADKQPVARILERGDYSKPGEQVGAGVPKALPPLAADQPANRLGLARWLVDKRNPLTARVTVNRMWNQIFGTGIVETTEDFGIMGARPSHPELLDFLAVEFMDKGWDVKQMYRTLVTSAAYKQSARSTPAQLEKDPRNRLLSRAPRIRLDAEPLRDLALSVSGLMNGEIGGPSVKPYQPGGVWEAVAMKESNTKNYAQDSGSALYRRSLYTFWKRTAPHPAMETLNAPVREVFCTRRERTNTPLQALVLMNDPQFVEATRVLAENVLAESPDARARMDSISRRLLARPLEEKEAAILTASLGEFTETFEAEPAEAAKLVAIGATPAKYPNKVELAAWTLVASQILNMDECVTR